MTELIAFKNKIRDSLRKADELVTPLIRFAFSIMIFFTIRDLFPFFDLTARTDICILLAVMSALLPDGFMVFMGFTIMLVNCFKVSIEVGIAFLLVFIVAYCVYIRFFPKYAYAMMLTLVCFNFGLQFSVPYVVAIIAGIGGAIPAALGVLLYYFAGYAEEVSRLMPKTTAKDVVSHLTSGGDKDQLDALQYLVDALIKNKEMLATMVVFAVIVLVIGIVYNLSFKYSWMVGLLSGGIAGVYSYIYMCYVLDIDANIVTAIKGALIGIGVSLIVRFFKGFVDYKHTERVQFEDDEYYYYVKAIPKIGVEKKPVVDFSRIVADSKKKARKPKAKSSSYRSDEKSRDDERSEGKSSGSKNPQVRTSVAKTVAQKSASAKRRSDED